jgi:hypothetical protein
MLAWNMRADNLTEVERVVIATRKYVSGNSYHMQWERARNTAEKRLLNLVTGATAGAGAGGESKSLSGRFGTWQSPARRRWSKSKRELEGREQPRAATVSKWSLKKSKVRWEPGTGHWVLQVAPLPLLPSRHRLTCPPPPCPPPVSLPAPPGDSEARCGGEGRRA